MAVSPGSGRGTRGPCVNNGRRFTGTNSLILCLAGVEGGYRSRCWMTRAQGKRYGGYFATLAHELDHWTGHGTRLAGDIKNRFGDPE